MSRTRELTVLFFLLLVPLSDARLRWRGNRLRRTPTLPHEKVKTKTALKDTQNFWLIPRDPQDCLAPEKAKYLSVDKDKVSVVDCANGARTLRFPGCAEIKADVQLLKPLPSNMFAWNEFKWENAAQFGVGNLKCEKQERNGCGGVGNGCYYCDVCNGITKLQQDNQVNKVDEFKCPTEPRIYQLTKKLNVSDLSALDANNDGVIDLLENRDLDQIKQYLKSIQVTGFGTLNIKVRLAYNATGEQLTRKRDEEKRIHNDVQNKYKSGQKSPQAIESETQKEINKWHRDQYLPWLLDTNEIACVNFFFDICLNRPSPFDQSSSFQCV